MTLPPGQRALDRFPRFGAHFNDPPPTVPDDAVIEIGGVVRDPVTVRVADLATMPRTEITADFHCVAGWSATGLRWEGVPLATFFKEVIEPALPPSATSTTVTHLVFEGLDGYRSVVQIEDALADDVLLADHLDGAPLGSDHGAPVRLLSPQQYGFMSTKHLCRIDVHTSEPRVRYHPQLLRELGLRLVRPHRRARVWKEERHRYLPTWAVRGVYQRLVGPIKSLSARGRN